MNIIYGEIRKFIEDIKLQGWRSELWCKDVPKQTKIEVFKLVDNLLNVN